MAFLCRKCQIRSLQFAIISLRKVSAKWKAIDQKAVTQYFNHANEAQLVKYIRVCVCVIAHIFSH